MSVAKSLPPVAVSGAGVSGLGAAWELTCAGHAVEVFEKSRGLSGRAASRSKEGCRYDHGANYFTIDSDELKELIFESLPTEDLIKVQGDIAVFDASGAISPGDPSQGTGEKWNYRGGINTIGKLMAESIGLVVHHQSRITGVRCDEENGQWFLQSMGEHEGRESLLEDGPFSHVVVSIPGPQSLTLIESSEFDEDLQEQLVSELEPIEYASQFSFLLHFVEDISFPEHTYALLNVDRGHDISWISYENGKEGRIPDGEHLLVVQMSPEWSFSHFDDDQETLQAGLFSALSNVMPNLPKTDWIDSQRWKFSLPQSEALEPRLASLGKEQGLWLTGDVFVGKGRVGGALERGLQLGRELAAWLED